MGSDIDGRSIRGKGGRDVRGNFRQYGLEGLYLDGFISDLTNSPMRGCIGEDGGEGEREAWLDGIVCDPPYGVREGLKVLGLKEGRGDGRMNVAHDKYQYNSLFSFCFSFPITLLVFFTIPPPLFSHLPSLSIFLQITDPTSLPIPPFSPNPKLTPTCREPGYIPPKRPYSFTALLDDVLHFASLTLVENGRLAMWMPTANDEDIELVIPTHPCLKVVSVCVQPFNKCKISASPSVPPPFPFTSTCIFPHCFSGPPPLSS